MSLLGWICPRRRRIENKIDEAKTEMARLEANDPEIKALGAELRAARRRNNFSGMVDAAIRQAPRSNP